MQALATEDARLRDERQALSDEFAPLLAQHKKSLASIDAQRDAIRPRLATLESETSTLDSLRRRFARLLGHQAGHVRENEGITKAIRLVMNSLGLTAEDVSTP